MWVDVIIPAYNPGAYLVDALESCMVQSYRDFTVTVVDDCSTEDVKKITDRFPVVNYIRTDKNLGPAGARNVGIKATNSELISFLDSDDIWDMHKLAHSVTAFRKSPKSGMVCGNYCFRVKNKIMRQFYKRSPVINHTSLMRQNYVASGSVTIKRSVLDEIDGPFGFDERYWIAEDYDLWVRISEKFNIKYLHKVLYYYTVAPGSSSLTQRADIQADHMKNLKRIRKESAVRMRERGKI